MIAFENWFGPKRFVLIAVSCVSSAFWIYQDRAPEHQFNRACQAEMREIGKTRAQATSSCNCVKDKSNKWFMQNPEGDIPQSTLQGFYDRCTGDYYQRQIEARTAAKEEARETRYGTNDWGEAYGDVPEDGWGR